MCLILTVIAFLAAFSFYGHGLLLQAFLSALTGAALAVVFIRRVILSRGCIFGGSDTCNPDK